MRVAERLHQGRIAVQHVAGAYPVVMSLGPRDNACGIGGAAHGGEGQGVELRLVEDHVELAGGLVHAGLDHVLGDFMETGGDVGGR